MDATGDVEGGAGSQDSDRSSNRVDDDEKTDPNGEEEEDPNLLIVCVVIGLLLLLILVAASLSLLCLYKRHRHRLNCFRNSTLDADTDRLRRLTTGSDQASTSASASDATPVDASKRKNSSSAEQTGSRLIPKFLFSSVRSSTNQSATGTGSYGTIPTSTCPSGIGFPVPTKVSYVLLSNKSVESPESNPTSPEVVDASRPPNDPNSRIIRNRAAITGSQPGNAAISSRRSRVMGTLSSRGSNPNPHPPSATVASSPCRIVVDAVVFTSGDDDPPSSTSDLNKRLIVDSTSNTSTSAAAAAAASAAATAESRRSSYSSVIGFGFGGGAGDGSTDAASRRGSMSPRERSSIPFLWTLGPSSSAPSVGKEDSFWVPPTVLLKKRANSLAPPSLTVTADVDSGGSHHNGTAPRRSESVGRGGSGGSEVCGGGGGARGGPGQSNSASGRDMSSLTCSSTDRLSETWPSGEWTNGQQQQHHPHPHHQQQMQQQQLQQQRRRRASMQDALDFTKIDASLYERPPPLSCSQKLFGSVQEENLGSVHFSLTYDADLSVLTVRLMQAMDLSMPSPAPPPSPAPSTAAGGSAPTVGGSGDSGPPRLLNPYARLRLLPDERNVLQSRIHPRTLCPQFEEEFVFETTPTDLANRTLELMLMNDEHGGGGGGGCSARSVAASLAAAAAAGSAAEEDEGCFFGHVLLPLDQVDFTEPTTFLKGISAYERKPEPESYLGDIMFSLSYLPSAERMTVVITKARHLKQADISASRTPPLNPFVKVIVFTEGKKGKKKKTTTKRGSACPEWNEALVFGVAKDLLGGVQLEFLVLSENLLGTDDAIGKVVLGARSTGDDRAHWNDFLNGKSGISRWHRLVPSDV